METFLWVMLLLFSLRLIKALNMLIDEDKLPKDKRLSPAWARFAVVLAILILSGILIWITFLLKGIS